MAKWWILTTAKILGRLGCYTYDIVTKSLLEILTALTLSFITVQSGMSSSKLVIFCVERWGVIVHVLCEWFSQISLPLRYRNCEILSDRCEVPCVSNTMMFVCLRIVAIHIAAVSFWKRYRLTSVWLRIALWGHVDVCLHLLVASTLDDGGGHMYVPAANSEGKIPS
jgi:hypothetical protein